jgi:hypothetical protein
MARPESALLLKKEASMRTSSDLEERRHASAVRTVVCNVLSRQMGRDSRFALPGRASRATAGRFY